MKYISECDTETEREKECNKKYHIQFCIRAKAKNWNGKKKLQMCDMRHLPEHTEMNAIQSICQSANNTTIKNEIINNRNFIWFSFLHSRFISASVLVAEWCVFVVVVVVTMKPTLIINPIIFVHSTTILSLFWVNDRATKSRRAHRTKLNAISFIHS